MQTNLVINETRPPFHVITGANPRRRSREIEDESVLHILLVEDNPADADLCTEYLETAFQGNIRVFHVTRLIQAYTTLTGPNMPRIDAVLLDLALPDATGLEALIGLREVVPKVPIVILTGSNNLELGVAAMREHAEDYCPKYMLTAETIRRIVRHAMERHRWRNRYRRLLEVNPDGMIVLDNAGNVLFANVAALTMLGENHKLRTGTPFPHPLPGVSCKIELALPQNRVAEMSVVPLDWEGRPARLATLRDITASKLAEKKLLDLVQVDQLTGLASRTYFLDFLSRTLRQQEREDEQLALMFIDLDRFKFVNDSLGHRVGDALLQHVAKRFTESIRQGDFLGRLGGDEFGLILPATKRPEQAAYVARKLLDGLAAPFHIDGRELSVGASIGIAFRPSCGNDPEELLRAADAAMYRAKEHGRNTYHFYSQDLQTNAMARMKIEAAIRRAMENQEFSLHFQPQVSIDGNSIVAFEALLRWDNAEYGVMEPGQVIEVAEDIGLVSSIGEWVLHQATREVARWQGILNRPIRVAVNVSGQQLRQAGFVEAVKSALTDSGLAPGCLELEVTESVFIGDNGHAVQTLTALRQLGVSAVIDDFGTGYSSLSYLLKLPITGIKLDKRFVDEVGRNAQSETIIENLVRMSHAIGLTVTAEGVETEIQRAFLEQCGCDFVQGYHFSRPLPVTQIVERLPNWLFAEFRAGNGHGNDRRPR